MVGVHSYNPAAGYEHVEANINDIHYKWNLEGIVKLWDNAKRNQSLIMTGVIWNAVGDPLLKISP